MKKTILLALCAAALSANALPTYEPFTEFAPLTTNAYFTVSNGVVLLTNNALGWVSNAVDLTAGGFTTPGGETWTAMKYCSTNVASATSTGTNIVNGLDICVVSNTSIFTSANVGTLLPTGFPGNPAAGQSITNFIENPAQPYIYTNGAHPGYSVEGYVVGNSAVLTFAQDIVRPATGTKTLYISYLFVDAQLGQTGTGNDGRYLGFLAQSNLVEGIGTAGYYANWDLLFNTFTNNPPGAATVFPHYFGHGVLEDNGTTLYLGPCDSSAGKAFGNTGFTTAFNTPSFMVGAYVMVSTNAMLSGVRDTNVLWVNPTTSGFGGATPPASPIFANLITNTMNDVGGMVLIDRPGNGASGGVGTNYVANLILGSTWSYVTGGPEFTSQPANVVNSPGTTISLSAVATAAGQTVSYQWQKVTPSTTNSVTSGSGGAGGSAVVTGQNSSTLTLTGISAGDAGTYQLLATANGTTFTLTSATATVTITDPGFLTEPQSTVVNYGTTATFSAQVQTTTSGLSYDWYDGSTALANGPQSDGSSATGAKGTDGTGTSTITLSLANVSYLDNGTYSLDTTNANSGVTISTPATLTVNDPYIATQPPAIVEVASGTTGHIAVSAFGTGATYQWYSVSGGQLSNTGDDNGVTTSTLTISPASSGDAGSYYVIVNGASSQPVTSSNAVVYFDSAITGATVSPSTLTQQTGTHLAFTATVAGGTGGLVHVQWKFNGNNLANGTQADGSWVGNATATLTGPGTAALVLTNLHTLDSGTYTAVVYNGASTNTATGTLTVSSNMLRLYNTNLVVTRVGEGSQSLSGATGNTLYLDQFTTNGAYVSTFMVPDGGTGPIIVPGGAPTSGNDDSRNESYLTLSSNQAYLNFAGYAWSYPYALGADVTLGQQGAGGTTLDIRSIGSINALGYYVVAYTNYGLYSGGLHFIRSAYSTDGLTNFWTTGAAGSAAIKYVNAGSLGASYATGSGVPGMSLATNGAIMLGLYGSELTFSDSTDPAGTADPISTETGLNAFTNGAPEPGVNSLTTGQLQLTSDGIGHAADFAFSPDTNTMYVADDDVSVSSSGYGGVERWDYYGGQWNYSYNLSDNTGTGTNGLKGLTVVFPTNITAWGNGVTGAILYATTSESTTNRLISIVDTGSGSSSTLLATAGPNQFLRGVRFAPVAVPVTFPTPPQGIATYVGQSYTLTAGINGDAPLTYQWQFDGTNIAGATTTSLALVNLQLTNAGTYTIVAANPISTNSSSAVLTISAGPPTLVYGPQSRVETVGDHMAFTVFLSGTVPFYYQWSSNSVPIAGATNSSYGLSNIVVANGASYSVAYSNQFGNGSAGPATLLVTTNKQILSANNLVVARIGDGAEALSDSTGNTLYLDQFTPAGAYSNSIMIPDESATNLIVAGGPVSGVNEAFLNVSTNTYYLNFCGYDTNYPNTSSPPFNTASSSPGPGTVFRSIGAVNAYGYYTTVQVNETAYVVSPYDIESVSSGGGLDDFYATGFASAGGVKLLTQASSGPAGPNFGAMTGSGIGTRVVQIIGGNVVYSDLGNSPIGIWGYVGEPSSANNVAANSLITDAAGNPNDFTASPDTTTFPPTTSTVYLADVSSIAGGGGIQRYDWNGSSYSLSYTLGTGTGSTVGASCLVVDFSAHATWGSGVTGAKIYATTAGASNNTLIKIVDNGNTSTATVLSTANPGEILRGVRFGPAVQPLAFSPAPVSQTVVIGQEVDLTATVTGTGPITLQWNRNGNPIPGATGTSYSIVNVQATNNSDSYTLTATSPGGSLTSSPAAVLTVNSFSPTSTSLPLVGWWILNDGPSGANSGTTAVDSSSYADNGALNNFADVSGAEWVSPGLGSYSYALDYDDANTAGNNVVVVPDAPQLNFTNNLAFTLAAWVNLASAAQTNGAAVIAKGIGSGGEQYVLDLFTNAGVLNYRFYVRNAAGTTLTGTPIYGGAPAVGSWQHVAATYDGYSGIMAIYVNGVLANSITIPSSSLFYTTTGVSIGNRLASSVNQTYALPFTGKMQDARIYDVALAQQDIQSIYATLEPVAANPPQFATNGVGPITFTGPGTGHLNLSGTSGTAYRVWSTTNLYFGNTHPVTNSWTLLGSGTFSGGADTFPISNATNRDTFYYITQP